MVSLVLTNVREQIDKRDNQVTDVRGEHPLVAARSELVHLPAGNVEAVRKVLRRLAHDQADVRIGEALHQPDHRRKVREPELGHRRGFLPHRFRGIELG